ncbi:MAG: hypothetical protein U1C46_11875 [Bacteroidales bacterium]|nr:hypothetical protein [Bacteroidales bacterium]MDZ4205500.1 hypothetical protein [Bacteroidales bacterium]
MKHLGQILWLLSWPALIYISYRVVLVVLRKYEKKYPPTIQDKSAN